MNKWKYSFVTFDTSYSDMYKLYKKNQKLKMVFKPSYLNVWEIWTTNSIEIWATYYYAVKCRDETVRNYTQKEKLEAIESERYAVANYKGF